MSSLLLVVVVSAIAVVVTQLVTFYLGERLGRYNVVDVAWGIGIVIVAWISALLGGGDSFRAWVFVAIVTVWGLRLSVHIARKTAGKGEDPRYVQLLERSGGVTAWTAFRKIFLLQAACQWVVSLPLQVSSVLGPTRGVWWVVLALGIAVAVTGFVWEAVGDEQLRRFTADPRNKGTLIQSGLWSWTRHPNYFGDACLWWGLWLIAASAWPGALTVVSPLLMTYFLVYATGARLIEKTMSQRDGWKEYASKTSFFLPRPPQSGAGAAESQ